MCLMLNFTRIGPVGPDLFHVKGRRDRQTDMHTQSLYRNFANARKKHLRSVCVDQLCLWKPHCLHSASLWHLNCSWFIAVASVRITLTVTLLLTYRCPVHRHKFNVVVCTPQSGTNGACAEKAINYIASKYSLAGTYVDLTSVDVISSLSFADIVLLSVLQMQLRSKCLLAVSHGVSCILWVSDGNERQESRLSHISLNTHNH